MVPYSPIRYNTANLKFAVISNTHQFTIVIFFSIVNWCVLLNTGVAKIRENFPILRRGRIAQYWGSRDKGKFFCVIFIDHITMTTPWAWLGHIAQYAPHPSRLRQYPPPPSASPPEVGGYCLNLSGFGAHWAIRPRHAHGIDTMCIEGKITHS